MQAFLISLCMRILEAILIKGTKEALAYEAFREALVKAGKYKAVVDSNASREERKKAEDEFFS